MSDRAEPKSDRRPQTADRTRLTVALAKLEDVFTSEQVSQMIDVLVITFDNAVMRKCDQTFTILFNDKGYPIGFNGSNNVKPVRPVSTYKAE